MIHINSPKGDTSIRSDETIYLIPTHLKNQEQLNAWEEKNILDGQEWGFNELNNDILTLTFTRQLHKEMFNKTWTWAGTFRSAETNIGIHWPLISTEVMKLCGDVAFQLKKSVYSNEEIAIRFHHRLAKIHPFPNGNGRYAQLMADLFITQQGLPRFTWGLNQYLSKSSAARNEYINAYEKRIKRIML
jgi:Fic-DOC domain mobile mystery protein B